MTSSPKVGFNISPVVMKLHSGEFICRANFKDREENFIFSLTVLEPTKFVPLPYINQVFTPYLLSELSAETFSYQSVTKKLDRRKRFFEEIVFSHGADDFRTLNPWADTS